jgi:hypothetical protein
MRSQLLLGAIGSLGMILAIAACAEETTSIDPGNGDGGSSSGSSGKGKSSSGSSGTDEEEDGGTTKPKDGGKGDSSTPLPKLPADTLSQGDQQLFAIAGNDAIYLEFGATNSLFAVPIDGTGTPTKIADIPDDTSTFLVSGGVVGVWSDINDDGLGSLKLWTRATGLSAAPVATGSGAGAFFAGSEDGTRVAFSENLTVDATAMSPLSLTIRVRNVADTNNMAALTGTTAAGNAFNFASQNCEPLMSFSGNVFFAEFCTGTADDASVAKLITVPANSGTVSRLDAATAGAAATLKPGTFVADNAGAKVFALTSTNSAGRFFTVGVAGGTAVENDIALGTILPDGSGIIYRTTGKVLKKATTASPPVITTLVASGVEGLIDLSPDGKNVFFRKLAPVNQQLIDVSVVDHTVASPAAVSLVATASVAPLGVTGASGHLVFAGDITNSGANLKSIAVTGGTVSSHGATVGAVMGKSGNVAVSLSNPQDSGGGFDVMDAILVDVATGSLKSVASDVPDGEVMIKGKRLVYSRFAQTGSGIYAADLP